VNRADAIDLTICGSFGFGNAGDEAVPAAIADIAVHLGIEIAPHVVGRFDEPAMPEVIGLGAADAQRREMLRGHPLVMSGGGIIENKPSATLLRCESLLQRTFASQACLFGISVEPGVSYGWACKWRLRRCLRRFERVYTRDVLSAATLSRNFPNVGAETIGDLVLWLHPDAGELPTGLKIPERFIAVVLSRRWSQDEKWRAWISTELHALCRELHASIVFVPMSSLHDDDREEHRAVAAKLALLKPEVDVLSIESRLSPRAVAYLLGKSNLVVSMRLHGCVMAYAQQTAFIGLAYHPKVYGFSKTVGWGHALLPEAIPERQSSQTYGYRFSDLQISNGQLISRASACLSRSDFSRLSQLKQRSAEVFRDFLAEAAAPSGSAAIRHHQDSRDG